MTWKMIHHLKKTLITLSYLAIGCSVILFLSVKVFTQKFIGKIYPYVSIGSVAFGGKTPQDVANYIETLNKPYHNALFEFSFENHVATLSATELDARYDANLAAAQAYSIGRSGHIVSDIYNSVFNTSVVITPMFRINTDIYNQTIETLSTSIDIAPQEGLFHFENGKVTAFKPSTNGRRVKRDKTQKKLFQYLQNLTPSPNQFVKIPLVVETQYPSITTSDSNTFGIKERIGYGYSEFQGSIPGRIHNVVLAATRFNGVLIKPGETLSFNKTLGDVSAATGYQSAYIIKNGRTVLGDGGGVCQVSTTLFRAALNAGLPIVERHAHAYRVHYYEEAGYKAGIDATVFDPTDDFKITNNTSTYILIQTQYDLSIPSLTFELYGASDGRKAEITNQKIWDIAPPPPDLYQDDPTLKVGAVKQVDFAAWGAKASFDYKVTRNGETLEDTTFFSNYRPWQAVYLRGTQP